MNIEIQDSENMVTVVIDGDIEMMTLKGFKSKLLDISTNYNKDIEIDLSKVEYIDSSGVGVLITLLKKQKNAGKMLKIGRVSPGVLNVLKLSS